MSAKGSAKGSTKRSAKGDKARKAETEQLQKEEDERRIQEEEEARDQERREDELNEVRHLLEENQTAVKGWLADTRKKAKWDRYMLCDGRPDPCEVREVNTYISLWRDDPEVGALPVLKQCSLAIQDLVHHKHLLIAEEVLNHASSKSNIETGNMETVVRDDHVTMCLWANLNKNQRFKGVHFAEAGMGFELPEQLALSEVALCILHTRYDHLSPLARLTALGERQRPGGPEDLLDGGLQAFPYPEESSETQPDSSSSPGDRELLGLSLTVPDSVLLLEAPQVALWDPTDKRWSWEGVSDVTYEADEAKLSFRMDPVRAFTLTQETYAHLPLQDWTLTPLGQDSALFSVNTALVSLSVTVQGARCMLQVEKTKPGTLAHLQGRWLSCGALRRAMASAGLNLFVDGHTDRYVSSSCGKDPLSEHTVYEQMALLASTVAFSWSRWNAKCGACEHQGPAPVPRGRWSLYLLGAQRSQKLQMTEWSQAFSAEMGPDAEFHATFVHTLRDDTSPGGVAKIAHFRFVDAVQTLLCGTRPLNYSN
ncbi:hypothetical protein NHX12_020846 [Muraenolepis orangiensis]|uniref:Dynein axonemal intermediate chain 7 n=1 Tax=Muraenolepis orangiensis TaxID=630683 RepID=A0A9Q0EVM9_9TELE|nr:hypothetical protein NHX12_020846 [Muraenolepis orangiensis]